MVGSSQVLANTLKFHRDQAGFNQEAMAKKCGLSFRAYQAIEAGKGNPTLGTLAKIAVALRITSDRLIRLDFLRIKVDEQAFLEKFRKNLTGVEYGAAVRNFDGIVLWGNIHVSRMLRGHNFTKGSLNLMKFLTPVGKSTLKQQISCEQRLLVAPFVNAVPSEEGGETLLYRFQPTIVFPKEGRKPAFTAVFVAGYATDCHKNYFDYCSRLLSCV